MYAAFFSSMGQLLILMGIGYALFSVRGVADRALRPFSILVIDVFFPAYFFFTMMTGFSDAGTRDWQWMGLFFLGSVVTLGLQSLFAWAVTSRIHRRQFEREFRNESIILIGVHNAGYLPLPILRPVISDRVFIYLFAYVAAFNFLFWLVVAPILHEKPRVRISPPLLGILAGVGAALLHGPSFLPSWFVRYGTLVTGLSLKLVLVLLGGILATIPHGKLRFDRTAAILCTYKLVVYPVLALLMALLVPHPTTAFANSIVVALVIEAAVPPATNIMIAARAFGTGRVVDYMGKHVLFTYLVSLLTMPIVLWVTLTLFPVST